MVAGGVGMSDMVMGTSADEYSERSWGSGAVVRASMSSHGSVCGIWRRMSTTVISARGGKTFLSSLRGSALAGEGTGLLLPAGASETCSSTNGLGEMFVDDSTAAGEATGGAEELSAVGSLDVCATKGRGFFKAFALKASVLAKNGLVLEEV